MKRLGALLLTLTLGCAGAPDAPVGTLGAGAAGEPMEKVPALGDLYPIPQSSNHLMTASAQLWPYREVRIEGVAYDIASNREGRVAYIGTSDPAFKTPEGLSVGSTLEEARATGAKPPWPEPGWAYHTELPSGWSAAFTVGPEMTGGPLEPGAKVVFFFRR